MAYIPSNASEWIRKNTAAIKRSWELNCVCGEEIELPSFNFDTQEIENIVVECPNCIDDET